MTRINKSTVIIYKELSFKLNGLLYETHNELGRYRSERTYADYFERLLNEKGIAYQREKPIDPSFTGEHKNRNRPDFIVENLIIIDFKAKTILTNADYFQMQRYLSSSGMKLGILVNFRQKYIRPKRIVN